MEFLLTTFIDQINAYGGVFFLAPAVIMAALTFLAAGLSALAAILGISMIGGRLVFLLVVIITVVIVHFLLVKIFRLISSRFAGRALDLYSSACANRSVREVGGKARLLGRTADLIGLVPRGVVISRRCFEKFCALNSIDADVYGDSIADPKKAQELRRTILGGQMPRSVMGDLKKGMRICGPGALIIRSSFSGEDSSESAFPGVFHSEQQLAPDIDSLSDAVRRVWGSGLEDNCRSYLAANKNARPPKPAGVIVQRMVAHDLYGFAATVNYLDDRPEEIILDAKTEPEGRSIVCRLNRINETIAFDVGGQGEELSRVKAVAEKIRGLVDKIEQLTDGPAEVEWGISGEHLYIYQGRPLPKKRLIEVYTNSFIVELPQRPLTTFSADYFSGRFPIEQALLTPLAGLGLSFKQEALIRKIGGRFFLNWREYNRVLNRRFGFSRRLVVGIKLISNFFGLALKKPTAPKRLDKNSDGATISKNEIERKINHIKNLSSLELRSLIETDSIAAIYADIFNRASLYLSRWAGIDENLNKKFRYSQYSSAALGALDPEIMGLLDKPPANPVAPASGEAVKKGARKTPGIWSTERIGLISWPPLAIRMIIGLRDLCLIRREEAKFAIVTINMEVARRLKIIETALGLEADSIYFLRLDEISEIANGRPVGGATEKLIEDRRAEYAKNCAESIGPIIYYETEADRPLIRPPRTKTDGSFNVIGAGDQIIRGRLFFADRGSPKADDILYVADRSTAFNFLGKVAAIIVDSAGPLSHISLAAAEVGQPFASAVEKFSAAFEHQQLVELDLSKGILRRVL